MVATRQALRYTAALAPSVNELPTSETRLFKLYEADVHAYAMVLQNMNRELCRRLRRADQRLTELTAALGASLLL
jgi:hypothetical protein